MSEQKNMPLLSVEGLVKRFDIDARFNSRGKHEVKAVDHVSFEIEKGGTFSLVGESGCGKSTTGRSILRLVEPDGGVVKIDGKTVFNGTVKASPSQRELLPLRRDMQMIFQDPFASLDPRMTVGAIVTEGIKKHGIAKGKQAIELAAHTLELCGLDADNLRRYPHEFSGGQRQRIGIARALVLRPKFIIADEPIAALDVSIQAQVLNLLVDLQDQLGLTYLFISHDLGVVRHFCNRIGVMYLGNLVEMGDIETVYERPLHPYTEVLLSAIPSSESDSKARHIHLLGEPPSPVDPPTGCPFHPRCPYATEQCKREKPVLQQKDGRMVACWKYA